jgi:DNA-binding beta-propeller fold protein YncE
MGRATVKWAAAALVGAACFAPPALGADRIYWANSPASGAAISFAKLDGSGGADLATTGATLDGPSGVGLDPAAGRVYWVNASGNKVSFANLDGSGGGGDLNTAGATVNNPIGVAVDHFGGRIYWANYDGQKISFANLDGSGGADINTGSATVNFPAGVAVDRGAGRIYWANSSGGKISFANLDGSGGGDINIAGATPPGNAHGVAVDIAAGRIYWANTGGGPADSRISYARLDGTGGGDLPTPGATLLGSQGVAIDSAGGRIYWANAFKISSAGLDGSGGGDVNTTGATANSAGMPALLERPSGVAPPAITGGVPRGSTLSCSNGDWAADLVHELRYRAPASFAFQWSRDGTEIAGATSNSILAGSPGAYACRVTATNEAGSTSQTSAAHIVLAAFGNRTLVTLKLASRRIPARGPVRVRVANANGFQVTGRLSGKRLKVKRFSVAAHAKKTVKLKLPAKLRRALARKHKLKLPLTARVKDPAGQVRTVKKRVTLRLRRRGR